MANTVKEHTAEANALVEHVKEANALVNKLQRELQTSRSAFEWLTDFAPKDWVEKSTQYESVGDFHNNKASMRQMIEARVKAINALLGDRA